MMMIRKFFMEFRRCKTFLLILLALLVTLSCSRSNASKDRRGSQPRGPLSVVTFLAQKKKVVHKIPVVGTLFPDEEVDVPAEVEGRIEKIFTDIGDWVKRGEPLVALHSAEFKLRFEQEKASYELAGANLKEAEFKLKRVKSLSEEKLVSNEALEEAQIRVERLAKTVEETKYQMEFVQKKFEDTTIRAPFSGKVGKKYISLGQYLKIGNPVMTVVAMDSLKFQGEVPEKLAGRINIGWEMEISVEAYPKEAFKGKVARISPKVELESRGFLIEGEVPNSSHRLAPGSFAKANVIPSNPSLSILIPQDALYEFAGVARVFIITKDSKVKTREVKIGERIGGMVEVIEGLNEGELVATTQLDKLADGQKVLLARRKF
jgi:membrane fusion protein (multidrug efflux system)